MIAIREALLFSAFAILPMAVGAQEELMPGEVPRDEAKWPEPQVKEEWGLQLMKHNCPNHNVFVYKDKLYDDLFTRTLGWNGGDGVETTLLPDGNVFWSFNDSFYGVVDGQSRARRACSFRQKAQSSWPGTTGFSPHSEQSSIISNCSASPRTSRRHTEHILSVSFM